MKKIKSLFKPTVLALAIALSGIFGLIQESQAQTRYDVYVYEIQENAPVVEVTYVNEEGDLVYIEVDFNSGVGFTDVNSNGVTDDGDRASLGTVIVKSAGN